MSIINYILLLTVLLFVSCKKESEPQKQNPCGNGGPTTTYITASDLVNCKYKTGTYWVYIDSTSNTNDSLYISSFNQIFLTGSTCGDSYEAHSYNTVSNPSMKTHSYAVVAGGLFKDPSTVNTGTQIYDNYYSSSYYYTSTHFDSMFVYNQYYRNVARTVITRDPTENNYKTVYYINSDFGFLRTDILDSSGATISKKMLMRKNIVR